MKMIIDIDFIEPSPNPVRTSWDDEKMDELAQSIREQGLIVPIKVRPTAENRYQIIYGHRRVEAMRRISIKEIPGEWVIIEGLDDTDALIQALIENVIREDMNAHDIANTIHEMKLLGLRNDEIAGKLGWGESSVRRYLAMVNAPDVVRKAIFETPGSLGEKHFRVTGGLANEPEIRARVIEKIKREGLSSEQARRVSESVEVTKDTVVRDRLIDAPYSPYTHDADMRKERAERYGAYDRASRGNQSPSPDEAWRLTVEVSMMLNFIKKSREMNKEAVKMDEIGKFSPEARPFLAGKLRQLVKEYNETIERLERDG